jgi:predicted RNA-binding protein
VQEVRGLEENYYSLVQRAMPALPWLADFNQKLQAYIEQNFAAAYEFTREVSHKISFEFRPTTFKNAGTRSPHRCKILQKHTAR